MPDNDAIDVTSPYEGSQTAPSDDSTSSQLPHHIGRYRVERILGKGGFGMVYLAHDEELSRPVAIKVPHASLLSHPEAVEIYRAEARTVANLDHPHIVPVHDVGGTAETPFFVVSKYVEGSDLATILKDSRPSHQQAAELVATVADALHHAHRQGLVHRDIKPGNILIDKNGKTFVVDFGLALREHEVDKGASYVGTPAYMSPEQSRGEGHRVDGRSDIFSLGVVLYELLVGRRPFRADSRIDLLDQIIRQEPRPPRQCDDAIPKELDRICLKMLSKRASERHSAAKDASEDLRHFLKQTSGTSVTSLASIRLGGYIPAESHRVIDTPATPPTSDSQPLRSDSQSIKIVPKGLRSFDEHDADFFLELLPGPRDREGLPEIVRFWKTRLEENDPDKTFSVGLIYGPSGCGKSSLVKAGLLPRLSQDVISVYVEATAEETEKRLLKGLRRHCPGLAEHLNLKDSMATLRRGQGIAAGKKVLVVLDQFEQWLHSKQEDENSELVQALRQCDGKHVQCVVMVRDDFWMAATQFMRAMEIRLVEGHNTASVDRFLVRHAEKVLTAFGRAFGILSDGSGEISKDQKEFLKETIAGLAEDGKVVCVRLALFAEMMKGKPWTHVSLKKVGGTEGVGVTFLEETFSASTASPEHRFHQKAARSALKALLPELGSDIKGNMRSYGELLSASGYGNRPRDFDDLIRILDGEIRLITPTDPEGASGDEMSRLHARSGEKFYQLTHDYLVPSLRDWLTRKQKETRQGRAEIRLLERSVLWNDKPENRRLPSLWEYLNIRVLTKGKNWTESQHKMMDKAGRVLALRTCLTTVALIAVLLATREITGRFQAASLVDHLVSADIAGVPEIVERLGRYGRWAYPLLQAEDERAKEGSRQQLHLALALLPFEANKVDFLREQLLVVTPSQFPFVRDALIPHHGTIVEPLWKVVTDPKFQTLERFQAACALATYSPADQRWDEISMLVASHLVSRQASDFLAWREALRPAKQQLIEPLSSIYRDSAQERQYRIYATETLADYAADQFDDLFDLLADAERFQFPVIFADLVAHKERGVAMAQKELQRQLPDKASEDEKEALARRQTNAAVFLLRMGQSEPVWPHLRHSPDPRVRSFIIHWVSPLEVGPAAIIDRFEIESDLTIRRALLLILGEFNDTQLPATQRKSLSEKLLTIYENEPDAGLHSAAEWLLRKWGQNDRLQAIVKTLSCTEEQLQADAKMPKRQWYINTQGQTFVIVDSGEFMMGSPKSEPGHNSNEIQQHRQLERRFAIATTELTRKEASKGPSLAPPDPNYVKTSDSPEIGFTWYEAAQYCNWLSQREGIAEDQWCYKENEEGKYAGGMKVKANFLDLHGYRLPTEAEWEYSCRAGAVTSRFYGLSDSLLPQYAWYLANSQNRTWPVGSLKPNDLGLFDMLGNAYEWCHDKYFDFRPSIATGEDVVGRADNDRRVLRGGAFSHRPELIRSANRVDVQPAYRYFDLGFRPARTYP